MEYGLLVRIASVVDGVPKGVEYQPLVGARSDAGPFHRKAEKVNVGPISQEPFDLCVEVRDLTTFPDKSNLQEEANFSSLRLNQAADIPVTTTIGNRPVMPESWLDGDEDSDEML